MSSTYLQLPDGSAILTEMLPDGSLRTIRLPSPFVVDRGPMRNTVDDEAAIRAAEDRITKLDRRER